MIYKFKDPLFSDKIFKTKIDLVNNVMVEKAYSILKSLENLDIVDSVEFHNDELNIRTCKRFKNIQFTLYEFIGVKIHYYPNLEKKENKLSYELEVYLPKFSKATGEFIINGVYRSPLWQIIDHFSVSDKSIHLVTSCTSIHLSKEKGWIGIKDKITHAGNIYSTDYGLEKWIELLGFKLKEIKDNKNAQFLKDVIEVEETKNTNEIRKDWMTTFLNQKIKKRLTFSNTKEFWRDMCIAPKFRKFNVYNYIKYTDVADVFVKPKLKYNNISDELILRFLNNDYAKDRYDIMNKQLYLIEWILSPLIFEILTFLLSAPGSKTDKKKMLNIAAKVSANMSELNHLAEKKGINCIHGISEMLKISYSGPQGFDSTTVPRKLRDLQDSYYQSIDPVYTPDRKQTGVINWLTLNSKFFDKNYDDNKE